MFGQPKTSPHITANFMVGVSDRRKWLLCKSGQHKEYEFEGPTIRFPMASAIMRREVVGDMVREILRVVGLPPLETTGGRIAIGSLEM